MTQDPDPLMPAAQTKIQVAVAFKGAEVVHPQGSESMLCVAMMYRLGLTCIRDYLIHPTRDFKFCQLEVWFAHEFSEPTLNPASL